MIGIPSIDPQFKLLIYPNPAHDKFNVVVPGGFGEVESLEIFSQLGKKQPARFSSINKNQNSLQVDLSGFAAGIYFLKLNNDRNLSVVKFLVQ